jgi:DnaD/phage-associated family protein
MYLLTNENTTQCGVYTFLLKFAVVETGYNLETLEKLLKRFVEYGKVKYCYETKELMIINWLKYNFINSKPVINCINKELKSVKNADFVKNLYESCRDNGLPVETLFKGIETVSIGYTDHDLDLKIPLGEEEEKEIEREEEVEEKGAAEAFADDYNKRFKKVISTFDNNIHPMTPIEYEKICDWCRDVEFEVVIKAIEEAVKHNARTIAYIERVLNNWYALGIRNAEGVKAHLRDFKCSRALKETKSIPNAKAYEYFDEEDLY